MGRGSGDVISQIDVQLQLPDDLAPALRARVDDLLRQVPLARATLPTECADPAVASSAEHWSRVIAVNRCVFCHRPGKLSGHHDERSGDVVWVHAKCHRRHHRAHRRTARGDRWWRRRVAGERPSC
jgi:hypothetical protein